MKNSQVLQLLLLALISCNNVVQNGRGANANSSSVRVDTAKKDIDEPNIRMLRQRLFDYFERNKTKNVFDTTDYTYGMYWGPTEYPPYSVEAGHLFNKRQYHAVVFYSDGAGAGLTVYLKGPRGWKKIFEDTSIDGTPASAFPDYRDWNRDGVKDISLLHGRATEINETTDLWLMDRKGDRLYALDSFSEIVNPEQDSLTGHILSYSTCGCADNCMLISEYAFKGYELKKLYFVNIACCLDSKDPDSLCEIRYDKPFAAYRSTYTRPESVYKYVPKAWKDVMYGKYNR
ncbi:MAG: hypothetical protein JSS96_08955 [Bacteroidetes bacterium]|nr:hypothetical protein [Bacteroidota bacterium]